MTTERKPATSMATARRAVGSKRPAAALTLSPLELRLWLVTALAGGYALLWLALSPGTPPAPALASTAPEPTEPAPRVAWIADLPPLERPVVVIPDGWTRDVAQLRTTPAQLERKAPRVVRVSRARPNRVRTRSS